LIGKANGAITTYLSIKNAGRFCLPVFLVYSDRRKERRDNRQETRDKRKETRDKWGSRQ
jgi:hypothetical protein